MSRFLDPLQLELMRDPEGRSLRTRDGRQLWRLLARFRYLSDVAGPVEVPAGFVTDLASVPQWALGLFGETAQEPSLPHDFAYSTGCMARATADKMLYEACVLTGVPRWKAWLIYTGVRIGGGGHYGPQPSANDPVASVAA